MRDGWRKTVFFWLSLHACFFIFSAVANDKKIPVKTDFQLSAECPPGFHLDQANACRLRSLYQLYSSVQNRGIGGTRTGLPGYRDGFSPQQIDLGRYLFFDPILSRDQSLSCASCHQPALAFTDGKAVSQGIDAAIGIRSAPSLWNSAFATSLFWDARAKTLEQQAQGPLYSKIEMGATPQGVLSRLQDNANYAKLFKQAFPEQPQVSLTNLYTGLAAFQASLISLNSRYDQYVHGDQSALNEKELAGLNVFRSFVARCAECHTPPLFSNQQIAVIGTPEPEGMAFDIGAQASFKEPKLRGGFKVPSLRNIALTAPYMHSGRFLNLKEAARFYTLGRGHAVPQNESLQIHWHIWEPNLQEAELDNVVSFLQTLTDQQFSPVIPQSLPSGLAIDSQTGLPKFKRDGTVAEQTP